MFCLIRLSRQQSRCRCIYFKDKDTEVEGSTRYKPRASTARPVHFPRHVPGWLWCQGTFPGASAQPSTSISSPDSYLNAHGAQALYERPSFSRRHLLWAFHYAPLEILALYLIHLLHREITDQTLLCPLPPSPLPCFWALLKASFPWLYLFLPVGLFHAKTKEENRKW